MKMNGLLHFITEYVVLCTVKADVSRFHGRLKAPLYVFRIDIRRAELDKSRSILSTGEGNIQRCGIEAKHGSYPSDC